MQINSKQQFYQMYNRCQLGNMLRNWTLPEWHLFDVSGIHPVSVVAARCTSRPGAPMTYSLDAHLATNWVLETCRAERIDPTDYQYAELAPDHINTLQGELKRSERYLELRYTLCSHKRMRDSLNDSKHAHGLEAHSLLKTWMDIPSYEWVMDLFDLFPDSIIEFASYERAVGILQQNTLIWEVRNY